MWKKASSHCVWASVSMMKLRNFVIRLNDNKIWIYRAIEPMMWHGCLCICVLCRAHCWTCVHSIHGMWQPLTGACSVCSGGIVAVDSIESFLIKLNGIKAMAKYVILLLAWSSFQPKQKLFSYKHSHCWACSVKLSMFLSKLNSIHSSWLKT